MHTHSRNTESRVYGLKTKQCPQKIHDVRKEKNDTNSEKEVTATCFIDGKTKEIP